jgi:hypothetical protein
MRTAGDRPWWSWRGRRGQSGLIPFSPAGNHKRQETDAIANPSRRACFLCVRAREGGMGEKGTNMHAGMARGWGCVERQHGTAVRPISPLCGWTDFPRRKVGLSEDEESLWSRVSFQGLARGLLKCTVMGNDLLPRTSFSTSWLDLMHLVTNSRLYVALTLHESQERSACMCGRHHPVQAQSTCCPIQKKNSRSMILHSSIFPTDLHLSFRNGVYKRPTRAGVSVPLPLHFSAPAPNLHLFLLPWAARSSAPCC